MLNSVRFATSGKRKVTMEANNMKAMRDALVDLKREAETTWEYMDYPIAGLPGERGSCPVVDADRVIDVCNAALAKPPRNCDVHTADELKGIFNSELVLELPIANEHEKNLVTITAMGVIDTLFAPAKELKGATDEQK